MLFKRASCTLYLEQFPGQISRPDLISEEEICTVLATCKPGKSCGDDGVSYELLQLLMQTECRVYLVDLFNSVLFQTTSPEASSRFLAASFMFSLVCCRQR